MLGELLASQLYFHITTNVLKSEDYRNTDFYNKPEVGNYLKESIFAPGAQFFWNDMIEKATGEKLTAKYYAKQFVN
jgi:peptidyl-dipeptidase A